MQPPMKQGSFDDFQTPKEALYPLMPFLKKDWIIWECASGKGNLVKGLSERGFIVNETDILGGVDFLRNPLPNFKFDCIITNPPYSLKQEFLQRCYELKKPFGLLLPLTTFETVKRQELFKKYGLEVIFFDRRINFVLSSGKKSSSWFATAWFTNWLNIGKSFTFVKWQDQTQKRLGDLI